MKITVIGGGPGIRAMLDITPETDAISAGLGWACSLDTEFTGADALRGIKEVDGGYKKYNALMKAGEKHSIEKVGARLRSMMPWMQKRSIKGAQASY